MGRFLTQVFEKSRKSSDICGNDGSGSGCYDDWRNYPHFTGGNWGCWTFCNVYNSPTPWRLPCPNANDETASGESRHSYAALTYLLYLLSSMLAPFSGRLSPCHSNIVTSRFRRTKSLVVPTERELPFPSGPKSKSCDRSPLFQSETMMISLTQLRGTEGSNMLTDETLDKDCPWAFTHTNHIGWEGVLTCWEQNRRKPWLAR